MVESKKFIVVTVIFIVAIVAIAIVFNREPLSSTDSSAKTSERQISVVATFYPLQQLTAAVVGDLGEVKVIVPAGMEPHDYEPSIGDIRSIYDADLFVINGAGMDAWAEKLMPELESKEVQSLRFADKVELIRAEEDLEHEESQEDATTADTQDHGEWDPHFWLDPKAAKDLVGAVTGGLSGKFPEQRAVFESNALRVVAELNTLDDEYRTGLAACIKDEVVTSHDAFRYLSARYGFETHAIAGLSPNEEPSPKRLVELTAEVKAEGIKYIFFEALVSPKMAETLARETGTETLVFDPIEGVSDVDSAMGVNYFSLMRDNLAALRKALECK